MTSQMESDVVVVGAGPGGSATAAHLARRGLHVTLLEKVTFPRDKVCGDGLTPRAVEQLIRLGIDVSEEAGWKHTEGLRIHGGRIAPSFFPGPSWPTTPISAWCVDARFLTSVWLATPSRRESPSLRVPMSLIRSSISAAAFAASGPPMAPSIPPPLSSRLMATLRASA